MHCLLNEKKKRLKLWSKDLKYEKTFRLSSDTPGYNLMSCPGAINKNKSDSNLDQFVSMSLKIW